MNKTDPRGSVLLQVLPHLLKVGFPHSIEDLQNQWLTGCPAYEISSERVKACRGFRQGQIGFKVYFTPADLEFVKVDLPDLRLILQKVA